MLNHNRLTFFCFLLTLLCLSVFDLTGMPGIAAEELQAQVKEPWALVPLGPDAALSQDKPAARKRKLQPTLKKTKIKDKPVTLVRNGKPACIIVTADKPAESAAMAATEIRDGLQKMSGAQVLVIQESGLDITLKEGSLAARINGVGLETVVLVGETEAGRKLGFNSDALPEEGYRLKAGNGVLIVLGRDSSTAGSPTYGTRHGAIGLLERHLGFRWLWPGELGEVVPPSKTITLSACDESDAPAIGQRILRNSWSRSNVATDAGLKQLGLTAEQYKAVYADAQSWVVRQRLGSHLGLQYGHAFNDWYERFGKEHPEWFALQPDGTRVPSFKGRERLCVSNSSLIGQVAEEAIAKLKADPALASVSACPNDGGYNSFCMCEQCRRLDPPKALPVSQVYMDGDIRKFAQYPSLSDRYVTFFSRIAEKVADVYPDKMVAAYAYAYYRTPPLYARVHSNVLIGFVGLDYFNDILRSRDLVNWDNWANKAGKFFLRPNVFHTGHAYPAVYVKKLDSDIKHCYETGMIAADFDSILHHWGTQGLNYYVLAKLLWDPASDADALVQDYCRSGFGPAAPQIYRYFKELEKLTNLVAQASASARLEEERRVLQSSQGSDVTGAGSFTKGYDLFLMVAPKIYTEQSLGKLQVILEEARQAASGNGTVLERIDFLALGVRYAEMQSKIYGMRIDDKKATEAEAKKLLDERQQFYKYIFTENPLVVNVALMLGKRDIPERSFLKGIRTRLRK